MVRQIPSKLKKTSTLWIFCEGDTEKRYFQNLRITERLRLKIKPKVSDTTAKQIVAEASKFMKSNYFDDKRDIVACFFDKDNETQNSNDVLAQAKRQAADKIILAFSNPCFEYWILCHDGYYPSNSYNQSQVCNLVKTKFGFDPKKETALYEKTKESLSYAKTNAKRIQKKHEDNNIELISRDSTPLSLVYKILELIDNFK